MSVKTVRGEGATVAHRICEAVAARTDADARELPPLYRSIDPDALEAFLRTGDGATARGDRTVEFAYHGFRVTVDDAGRVDLLPDHRRPSD